MEPTVLTPRLKLTLITAAPRGSPELEWCHEIRSDEQATWWSILGQSKSLEDTEKYMEECLPRDGDGTTHAVVYAVHQFIDSPSGSGQHAEQMTQPTEFVGLVKLLSIDSNRLVLPEHLTIPASEAATTVTVELAYQFLPRGWGKGYATEAVQALFDACQRARGFWIPYAKLYVRGIVNDLHPTSKRVMEKTGMVEKGTIETKRVVFLAGEWRDRHLLHIFGRYLIE